MQVRLSLCACVIGLSEGTQLLCKQCTVRIALVKQRGNPHCHWFDPAGVHTPHLQIGHHLNMRHSHMKGLLMDMIMDF